jgi:hydrogenase maturation protease
VEVVDFGIRGFDLGFRLLDGFDSLILVDAVRCGGAAGTLYLIEPDLDAEWPGGEAVETHGMVPVRALRMAAEMGARWQRLRLVGCEAAEFEGEG